MRNTLITRCLCIISVLLSPLVIANDKSLEQRIAALESKTTGKGELWYDNLNFNGLVEVEAGYSSPDAGDSSSDLVVATVALGAEAALTENLSIAVALLYEEDDTDLEVDIATISYTHISNGFSLALGQDYLPFGAYSTALVNDPLTLELGETRETAFVASYESGYFASSLYLFNGDQDKDDRDRLNNIGARITFVSDNVAVGVDYISNLADSDGLQDGYYGFDAGEDVVDGSSIYGGFTFGSAQLFVEHLRALDEFAGDGNNSEPSATQFEISFEAGDFIYAAAYQETDEALFLGLPEERISVGLSTEILGGLGLAVELLRDEDYAIADGGTGDSTDSLVLQFAAEF